MKPEEQRICIAEACGWTMFRDEVCPAIIYLWAIDPNGDTSIVPYYLNDLNAMSAAIMLLCKKKKLKCVCNSGLDLTWECILTESNEPNCMPCDGDHYGSGDTLCAAMAEAFLKTIGKWKD